MRRVLGNLGKAVVGVLSKIDLSVHLEILVWNFKYGRPLKQFGGSMSF